CLAQELQRHARAGVAAGPDAPEEIGEARRLAAGDFEHRVAYFYAGFLCWTAGREAGDHEARARFGRIQAEPGPRQAVRPAELDHVVEDRREDVDRHDHVALDGAGVDLLLHEERADAEELAFSADQRRAAPLRMRGRGEERLIEHVFPVTGELALREHRRLERMRGAAVP